MAKRSPLFQDGAEAEHVDHAQKQARNLPYLIIWFIVWAIALSIGFLFYSLWGDEPWFGLATINPSIYRFMGDYSLAMIIIMLAVAFSGATEIWATPGAYFDPSPIESTFLINQLVTRYINYLGPLLGLGFAGIFYFLNWVIG